MKYETAKNLNNTRFKRLIGVAKPVFDEMVKVLKAEYQVKHARGGRIIHLDSCQAYRHDMRLLRESRRSLHRSGLILADSGYQGLDKIYFQAKTPVKSSKKKSLTQQDRELNHLISSIRIKVEHVFGKVKAYKIFSTTYRNHRRRFNLRMNLICGIINQELAI